MVRCSKRSIIRATLFVGVLMGVLVGVPKIVAAIQNSDDAHVTYFGRYPAPPNGRGGGGGGERSKVDFRVTLDGDLFPLMTVGGGKYRIIPLLVQNNSDQPLALSSEKDRVTARTTNPADNSPRDVEGILRMGRVDNPFWQALSKAQRDRLAYPESARAAAAPGANEGAFQRTIFVFFPADALAGLPQNLSFHIDSLNTDIPIEKPRGVMAD